MINKKNIFSYLESEKEKNKEISTDFYYRGDYHDITLSDVSDLIDMIDEAEEFNDSDEVIDHLQYSGQISEYADSSTPIYYNQIAKWFGENWGAIDDYVEELGDVAKDSQGKADIMKTIQCAYCMSYERDLIEALKRFIESATDNN